MAWAPSYCTTAELKAFLRIASGNTDDDAQMALSITAASRAIDQVCNRQFGLCAAAEARYYTAEYDYDNSLYIVEIDDLMTVTGFLIKVDTVTENTFDQAITSYRLHPYNAPQVSKPWTSFYVKRDSIVSPSFRDGGVEVTGKFGWSAVPDPVKEATKIQAARFFARRDSALGVSGSGEFGNLQMISQYVEPDVRMMLRKYKRWYGSV